MANWFAPYKIDGGMYGGRFCANGSLQWLANMCTNTAGGQNAWRGYGGSRSTDEPYNEWPGAYGMNWDLLRSYMMDHDDGDDHEFVLLEIAVNNPEGAQFYKQSIVFKIKTNATYRRIEYGTPPDDHHLDIDQFNYWIFKVCRREYPTPYSAYVDTDITTLNMGMAGNILRGGETSLLGTSYYVDDTYIALGTFTIGNPAKDYWGIAFYDKIERGDQYNEGVDWGVLGIEVSALNTAFGGTFDPEQSDDPNEDPDPSGGEGGDDGPGGGGSQDKHQDPIAEPDLPPLSATVAGFVTMYKMYETNMQTFAKKLYDPDVWSAVKQLFADPMDFICGILILPFSPHTSRSARPILQQVPPIAWDYYYPVIEQQYHIVDCGTIEVPEYYKTALDYSPYSRDTLYLPYIGYRELNADEVQGKTLKIKYHVDVMTGDCVAFIIRPTVSGMTPMDQVIAQFSGNCGVHVPFGRQSFDNAIAASVQLISGVGGLAGGLAMMAGGAGGLASGGKQLAEGMIASSVAGIGVGAVNGSKAHVERAGIMGASAGYMGVQTPYLIRQLPNQSLPDKGYYRRLNGYPCNEAGALREFSGYTAIESIELSGIGATQEEKTEILNMMLGGVIV